MSGRNVVALIVAAGRGERFGSPASGPKQYRRIGGKAILTYTLEAFAACPDVSAILVVIHPDDEALFAAAAGDMAPSLRAVHGGATRQASVLAGLRALGQSGASNAGDIVLIHDAARPFIDTATIRRVIAAIEPGIGALPAVAVSDTLKRAAPDGTIAATIDRAGIFSAQTPQGFLLSEITAAHRAAAEAGLGSFTDDAGIAEWAGHRVRLVEGSPDNVKLTIAQDLQRAMDRIGRREESEAMIDVRTGNGYDVHQLVAGDHVTLCGVRIASDMALAGHSDADVGLHALTDALLATCGAGDIGTHFPPSDMQWKGAASKIFVEKAVGLVAAHGGRIANMDVTLICEAPKIAPHREAMRAAIADMSGVALERVSVKATTNETIGFVGRREGIAALATASVVYGEPT